MNFWWKIAKIFILVITPTKIKDPFYTQKTQNFIFKKVDLWWKLKKYSIRLLTPLWRSRKTLKSSEGLRGRHGGRAPIVYSECIIINNINCPSVITECLAQIIIHSEDKELYRDGNPSVIVIRTVNYTKG